MVNHGLQPIDLSISVPKGLCALGVMYPCYAGDGGGVAVPCVACVLSL